MKNFKEMLKKPSRESQPWALWIWNLTISESQLNKQFQWFVDNGFGGIAIRPSREMVPTYLSEEFLELFGFVVRSAQKHGIGIRIADDFSLPWSNCFFNDIAQSTKMRAQHLRLVINRMLNEREEVVFPEFNPKTEIALVFRYHNGSIDPNSVTELSCGSNSSSIKLFVS